MPVHECSNCRREVDTDKEDVLHLIIGGGLLCAECAEFREVLMGRPAGRCLKLRITDEDHMTMVKEELAEMTAGPEIPKQDIQDGVPERLDIIGDADFEKLHPNWQESIRRSAEVGLYYHDLRRQAWFRRKIPEEETNGRSHRQATEDN